MHHETFLAFYRHTALKANERNNLWIQSAYRFAGSALAYALQDSVIHPNHLTLVSLILAIIGSISIGCNVFSGAIWLALFLYQVAYVLDYADGSLARLRGQSSKFGGWFDVNADALKEVTLIFATCWYGYGSTKETTIWLLGFWLVSVIHLATKARDSYAKLAAQTHEQSFAYKLKLRMAIVRNFSFVSAYLYVALPVVMLLNQTVYGLMLICAWATISLLYPAVAYPISLVQQDRKSM